MASVHVLYFAAVRELVGQSEETLALPEGVDTVARFTEHLQQVRPAVQGKLGSVRIAVNEAFAGTTDAIGPGDTVALIPPVAGG